MSALKPGCRVVLDTNVVLSALLFRNGRLASLRLAWQQDGFKPVVNRQTMTELARVLSYAKFRLDAAAVHEALNLYLPHAQVHVVQRAGQHTAQIPQCRDPKDQMFLDLAHGAKVNALVTGDQDLLVLDDPRKKRLAFRILTPHDFLLALKEK